jgi:hypothetical protein
MTNGALPTMHSVAALKLSGKDRQSALITIAPEADGCPFFSNGHTGHGMQRKHHL